MAILTEKVKGKNFYEHEEEMLKEFGSLENVPKNHEFRKEIMPHYIGGVSKRGIRNATRASKFEKRLEDLGIEKEVKMYELDKVKFKALLDGQTFKDFIGDHPEKNTLDMMLVRRRFSSQNLPLLYDLEDKEAVDNILIDAGYNRKQPNHAIKVEETKKIIRDTYGTVKEFEKVNFIAKKKAGVYLNSGALPRHLIEMIAITCDCHPNDIAKKGYDMEWSAFV